MADLRWALLCNRAIIDKYTNVMSLFEVLESLTLELQERLPDPVPPETAAPVNVQMVSLWIRSNREQAEKVWCYYSIVAPDGEEVPLEMRHEIDLDKHQRTRLIAGFRGIPFRGPGTYTFKLYVAANETEAGSPVLSVPLELKIKPMAESAAPSG